MAEKEIIINEESVRVRIMELAPGESTTYHYHSEVTDTMFCLTGGLHIYLKDPEGEESLEPGDRCTVPPGRVHSVRNSSRKSPSTYLLVQGVGRYDYREPEGKT